MKRIKALVAVLVCALALAALAGCRPRVRRKIDWAALERAKVFTLGGGDRIHVEVQGHAELTRDLVVPPDGMVSLPMVGGIPASGRLPEELAQDIARQLERFIKSPTVSVAVREIRSYAVYVLGEVRRPGEYRAQQPLTLLQALALAGGFTPFADRGGVLVLRRQRGKSAQTIPIDYDRILSGAATEQNIPLRSGDTVVVP